MRQKLSSMFREARLMPVSLATKTSKKNEISVEASLYMIHSKNE